MFDKTFLKKLFKNADSDCIDKLKEYGAGPAKFKITFGWYPREIFSFADIGIGRILSDFGFIEIIRIQFLKFIFSIVIYPFD